MNHLVRTIHHQCQSHPQEVELQWRYFSPFDLWSFSFLEFFFILEQSTICTCDLICWTSSTKEGYNKEFIASTKYLSKRTSTISFFFLLLSLTLCIYLLLVPWTILTTTSNTATSWREKWISWKGLLIRKALMLIHFIDKQLWCVSWYINAFAIKSAIAAF